MRGVLKFSAGFGSGLAVAAGLSAWLMVPPPHEAAAAPPQWEIVRDLDGDGLECLLDNLKDVGSEWAAQVMAMACVKLEGSGK